MKGVTQVVGTVLLIGLTVAAVSAASTQIFGLLNSQNPSDVVPEANPGELRLLSCWEDSGQTMFSMRNGQSEQKLNTSRISLLVNGSTTSFSASQTIVPSQETFRLTVSQTFGQEAVFDIVSGKGKEERFRCRNL